MSVKRTQDTNGDESVRAGRQFAMLHAPKAHVLSSDEVAEAMYIANVQVPAWQWRVKTDL
jgi:hypothetical protein